MAWKRSRRGMFNVILHAVTDFAKPNDVRALILAKNELKLKSAQIRSLVKLERDTFIDKMADRIVFDFNNDRYAAIHADVRETLAISSASSKVTKHTKILDRNGKPTQSQFEESSAFQQHFARTMHGSIVPFRDVVHHDMYSNKVDACIFQKYSMEDLLVALPAPTQVGAAFASRKVAKGWGEDNINNRVIVKFSQTMMSLQYALYVKTYTRLAPPLQWKGGLAAALFKGKGSPALVENHRDIMLGNDSGKSFTGHVRRCIMPIVKHMAIGTQFGSGMNGGETAFAHLLIRSAIDVAKFTNSAVSVLFVDMVSAFATMLRRLVFDTTQGDEAWISKLRANGYSENEIKKIFEHLSNIKLGEND